MHYVYHLLEHGIVLYVGRSIDPIKRLEEHRRVKGRDFTLNIVFQAPDFDTAATRELADIAALKPAFNIRKHSARGHLDKPHSAESRAAITASLTGRKSSPETKARVVAALTGRPVTDATRAKMRDTWARRKAEGFKHTEATRANMRAAAKLREARKKAHCRIP